MDVGYDHPDAWPHASFRRTGGPVAVGQDLLMADFCSVGDRFYLRGLLSLPIMGTDSTFAYGPWAEVAPKTFQDYRRTFGTDAEASLGRRAAHLANALPGFTGSLGLGLEVHFLGGTDRPRLEATASSDLREAQIEGINFDLLLDIYASFGQDLRPHLGEA